jgi:ADP-heptose:LPS heptosyltransferase
MYEMKLMRRSFMVIKRIGQVYGYNVYPALLFSIKHPRDFLQKTSDISKLLILNHHGIGDVVMSFPCLKILKECFPSARFLFSVASSVQQQLIEALGFENVRFIKLSIKKMGAKDFWELFKVLRREKPQLGISTYGINAIASKLLFLFSGIKIGFGYVAKGSLKSSIRYDSTNKWRFHKVYQNFALAKIAVESLGCKVKYIPDINLPIKEEELLKARNILMSYGINPENRLIIGIHCGGALSSRNKVWPAERFSSLIEKIKKNLDCEVILFGGPDEVAIADKVVHSLRGHKVINLVGKTSLPTLAALIKNCKIMVGCDTGVMHIASAVNTPSILIFSNYTDPYITAPFNPNNLIIKPKKICAHHRGPIGCSNPKCINDILVEDVFLILQYLLNIDYPSPRFSLESLEKIMPTISRDFEIITCPSISDIHEGKP